MKSYSKLNETKQCPLCGEYKLLCDSHILPEFVYRPSYDPTHTEFKIDINKNKLGKTQKGFSEWMLCTECEGLLICRYVSSRFESHGEKLIEHLYNEEDERYKGDRKIIDNWAKHLNIQNWFEWTDFQEIDFITEIST